MNIRTFKTGDIILIVSIAVIAVLFFAWSNYRVAPGAQLKAVITQDGKLIKSINLSALQASESVYINEPLKQVIVAEKGRIRFITSTCPNQTCVKTGWLTKPGDRAVCIPSKVIITIVGDNEQIDTFSY
ncbi:MAG: NusG domain II-containing protein [Syntrophomonadaceae bacterium]